MLSVLCYSLAWLLFVVAQAQNSVRSTANGLRGWAGLERWLVLQSTNVATRAFFAAVFYPTVVKFVAARLASVGLELYAAGIAGLAGYAVNGLLYQLFGYVPWLRVEVQDLAPPAVGGK